MILDGRFPRLSPDGRHVACGALVVSIDGVVVGPGTTPVWLDNRVLAYTRQPDGALMRMVTGGAPVEIQPAAHEPSSLCASPAGRIAWRERDGVHVAARAGQVIRRAFRPTFAGEDLCWCLDTGTTADLYREGRLVARSVHDVRGMPDGRLCYIQVEGAEQWTCVQLPDGTIQSWRLVGAQEYHPLVLDLLGEAWVLSHTRDDRLLLRSGNNGLVVATGATFEPDAVVRADGTVRVVWADERGVLVDRLLTPLTTTVFSLTGEGMAPETRIMHDLRASPVPAVDPWPPGRGWTRRADITEIDIVEYLLGSQDWSRNGMHVAADGVTYSHAFQSRVLEDGENHGAVQHTKFGPPDTRAATWTFNLDWVGLAFDGTNELAKGYRFVNRGTDETAAIYPRRMLVGQPHGRVVELDLLDLATGDRRPLRWAGWVEAVYDGPRVGDIPPTTHAVIMFEPAFGDPRGWRERNICAQGLGCWYWDRHRKAAGAVPDMRWIGTTNVPRFPDIPARFSTGVPVAPDPDQPTPTPTPNPQPEPPTMKIWPYNDADAVRVIDFLDEKYRTPRDQGGLGRDAVDHLGYARWFHDAIRLLDGARSVDATLREINRRINAIAGLPADAWPGEDVSEPTDPEPDPDPGPAPATVLPIVVDGRILRDTSGAAVDWREVSAFMLLALWLGQNGGSPTLVRERLRAWRQRRVNTVRVFASIGHPTFWQARGWLLTPRTPGLYRGMHDLTVAAAAEGVRVRWTLLADTPDAFIDTPDVRAHVVACMDALRGLPVVIEVCNEPTMNGYGADWAQVLAELARSLDASAIVALGPEHGATGHLATADRDPADVVFFHAERRTGESGHAWLRRLGEYGVVRDGVRPVISGEPINAGDAGAAGDHQADPAIWFCYGALSRVVPSHGYAPCFHFHGGLWADLPNTATQRCLDAFHAGCDAVPLDVRGGAWTNGHHGPSPWRGYDQTDPPSDNRPSRIYGRIIAGEYWGVSIREPKGWTWNDLRYPVERVARAEGERFDCSVWRGRA